MGARFVRVDHDTQFLLPPDMRQWVPKDHLVHFIMDAVEELDVRAARVNQRGTGDEQYPPAMMLGLLVYCYASGVFSSRMIERMTYENVAVRMLCADTHPDHDTICAFRRNNGKLLAEGFAQVLEMAARCGVLKVGGVTVAIDGTKILANASKHAAVSYERAGEQMKELEEEIAALLAKAEDADWAPLEDGLRIPDEVTRRQERRAKLAAARAEMEARAYARAQAERAEYEAKLARREEVKVEGKKPRRQDPKPPSAEPEAKDQVNFSDPESRIMPLGGKGAFGQAYNAQAGVEIDSRLIVTQRVSNAPNDKKELAANVAAINPAVESVATVLVDSGFLSEEAVNSIECNEKGESTAVRVLAAVKRDRHGRRVADLEKKDDPPEPEAGASFQDRMAHRVATKAGRQLYKQRQQTIEPVFAILKEAMGFRRFSLRGQIKASLEWTLVCLAYNLRRLHRVIATRQTALQPAS